MEAVHLNYFSENGEDYRIFCKKEHKIIEPDYKKCGNCPYLSGSLQGNGVECYWDDPDAKFSFVDVRNPDKELMRVSKLIDNKKIKKG